MTLPNGADGLADNIALAFPLSAEQLDPNQSLATRDGFDQPTVEELLKDEIRASAGWNTAHQAGYGGLPAGLPQIIGILAKVAEQYTGIPVSTWVAQWNANPVLANLSTVVTDSLAAIYQTSVNIQAFLGSLDFTDPDFDLLEAAETFIDLILAPVGKIATLIGGFISSLIIPGLDASKITTGTFGTGTIPDLDASKIISGIFAALRIPGLDASKITTGTFGESLVPGIPSLRDVLVNAIQGWSGLSGWTDTTLSEAANAQRNTIAAQAAEIDRLKARFQSSGFSGVWSVDDFEWTTPGWARDAPNGYRNGYSSGSAAQGGVYVTGHEMGGAFTGTPGNFDHAVAFDWDPCQTDYMKVSAVLNNAFNYRNDGIFDNRDRTMYVLIRSSFDTSTWTRWRLQMRPASGSGIRARLQSWNGSTFVEHGTEATLSNLSGGTTIEAVAGVAGNLRRHQLLINGQVVHTVDDTANHGPIGASNRYAGFGAAGVHNGAFIFQIPFPFVNHVVWQDNAAGTRVGCGAEGWRTSTGTITANAGLNQIPMGFMQFTSLASGDMDIDTNWNHGFYPLKAGWYLYEASVKISTGLNDRIRLRLFNWNNSAFVTKENLGIDVMRGLNGGAALQLPRHAQGAAIVYIDPADTNNWNRYLGYEATGVNTANVFTGDATGIETWAKMTFIDDKRPT